MRAPHRRMRAPHGKPPQTVRDAAARSFLRWIYAHGYPAKRIFATWRAPCGRRTGGRGPA